MSFNLTNDLLKVFVSFNHALEVFMTKIFYRLFLFIFLVGTLKMTKIYNKWIYEFPHTKIKGNISYLFPINILFINLWHSKMRPHLLIYVIRSRVAMIQTFSPLLWCFATYYKTLDSWKGYAQDSIFKFPIFQIRKRFMIVMHCVTWYNGHFFSILSIFSGNYISSTIVSHFTTSYQSKRYKTKKILPILFM